MNAPLLLHFKRIDILPGKTITVSEFSKVIPFEIKRAYWVDNVSITDVSEHAHKTLHQVIVPLSGSVRVKLEDSTGNIYEYLLDKNDIGLHIPPMFWKRIFYEPNLILLCFASEHFDDSDYIRKYSVFKRDAET